MAVANVFVPSNFFAIVCVEKILCRFFYRTKFSDEFLYEFLYKFAAPKQPPINVQLIGPDPRHIRVTWESPPVESWECNEIWFEMELMDPKGPKVRLDQKQTQHVLTAKPNELWQIRIRTANTAGFSPWSRAISTTTPPIGDLIEDLRVTYPREVPTLSWRSIKGVEDLVMGYKVEFQLPTDFTWKQHSSGLVNGPKCKFFSILALDFFRFCKKDPISPSY